MRDVGSPEERDGLLEVDAAQEVAEITEQNNVVDLRDVRTATRRTRQINSALNREPVY
ncbi:MAG: hypothetical protein VX290_17835 [Candidatus Latescibacterota bacterium]|nr:hypothetical protein [Candidatus Latescibacterota bacterium]